MKPLTFKSRIVNSLGGLILPHMTVLALVIGIVLISNDLHLSSLNPRYLILVIPYVVVVYIYAGLFNNDIIITGTTLEIINSVPLFKKRILFELTSVKTITLRHDWTETIGNEIKQSTLRYCIKELVSVFFPYNYKWIKIEAEKKYKFYCFGIDYDYYENEKPYFEDLYKELKNRQASVNWTK
jgi:hypothetical protein